MTTASTTSDDNRHFLLSGRPGEAMIRSGASAGSRRPGNPSISTSLAAVARDGHPRKRRPAFAAAFPDRAAKRRKSWPSRLTWLLNQGQVSISTDTAPSEGRAAGLPPERLITTGREIHSAASSHIAHRPLRGGRIARHPWLATRLICRQCARRSRRRVTARRCNPLTCASNPVSRRCVRAVAVPSSSSRHSAARNFQLLEDSCGSDSVLHHFGGELHETSELSGSPCPRNQRCAPR